MAGSRAAHNWRRRMKLMEKQGIPYSAAGKGGKGGKGAKGGKGGKAGKGGKGGKGGKEGGKGGREGKGSGVGRSGWEERKGASRKRKAGGEAEGAPRKRKPSVETEGAPRKLKGAKALKAAGKEPKQSKLKSKLLKKRKRPPSELGLDAVAQDSDDEGASQEGAALGRLLLEEAKKRKAEGKRTHDASDSGGEQEAATAKRAKKKLLRKRKVGTAAVQEGVEPKTTKKGKKRRLGVGSSDPEATGRSKLKLRTKVAKRKGEAPKQPTRPPGEPSQKKLLKLRLRAHQSVWHRAHVICPGSITDRYARGPMNGYERHMLFSGGLSWRWLREPREDEVVAPPQEDEKAHATELDKRAAKLQADSARRLRLLDDHLETHGLWPACPERVALAERLRARDGLRRRCERHFEEVLAPLLEASPEPASASSEASLRTEARRLCLRCAEEWQKEEGRSLGSSPQALRGLWEHMLRRAAVSAGSSASGARGAWLKALRCALFARLCPRTDAEAQLQMFQAVASAARSGGGASKRQAAGALVLLPLGVFTLWQALLVAAAALWLGSSISVLRRTAAGPPEVVFRSANAA